jgi:N6-L-threonylcarbamoyladenine synthase
VTAAAALVLGVETSCDETAVALVEGGHRVLANVVSSQVDLHAAYGGVVPEIASRAHLERIDAVLDAALDRAGAGLGDVGAVAATTGPGLIGALLVGVGFAKGLAAARQVPFVGVHHLEAHLFAAFLDAPDLEPPLVVLLVSGGHTLLVHVEALGRYRLLGGTLDDAAGEAFDKVARFLDLGYPGGPVIDRLAARGDPAAVAFPRAMRDEGFDFSFSGLKTSVVNHLRRHPDADAADVAASFQEAVVDVLVTKTVRAAAVTGAGTACLGGGVAANSRLRERFTAACAGAGIRPLVPSRAYCTDNAAMVAAAGHWRLHHFGPTGLDAGASPSPALPGLVV